MRFIEQNKWTILLTGQAIEPEITILPFPTFPFVARHPFHSSIAQTVPLPNECSNIGSNVRLEFDDALLGKDVRNDLALAGVFVTITSVENSASD
jgi:hypothetical protein